MTVYHFDFAADRWQAALDIEADRMRNVRIDEKHEFEQEKGRRHSAELDGGEDNPWDLEYKTILPLLWPQDSPYSHPVIGQREHVRGARPPRSSSGTTTSGTTPTMRRSSSSAVSIRPRPRRRSSNALRRNCRRATYRRARSRRSTPNARTGYGKEFDSKFDVPRMMLGFNTVVVGTPEDPILDVVQDILAGGKTSRLYRKLVEDERIAAEVERGNYAGRFPAWFAVNVELLQGKDRKKAEDLTFAELENSPRNR